MSLKIRFWKFSHWAAMLILLSAAAVLAYNYYYLVSKPYFPKRLILHNQILNGSAPSPYLYRVLIPYTADLFIRAAHHILPMRFAFAGVYMLFDFAGISLILVTLYFYLTHWFTWELSLLGALFCAAVMGVTSHEHYYQPWSFWEAGFFTLSLLFILQKRTLWLGLLVAAASLNRETALFIPVLFLATTQDFIGILRGKVRPDWKNAARFAAYLAIWIVIFFGLRLLRGNAAHVETLKEILDANLDPGTVWKIILNIVLFQGVFWIFAALGFRPAPAFVRRTLWIIPPYLILLTIWSYWLEVRLLMPLYAIIIPLALSFLQTKIKSLPA